MKKTILKLGHSWRQLIKQAQNVPNGQGKPETPPVLVARQKHVSRTTGATARLGDKRKGDG